MVPEVGGTEVGVHRTPLPFSPAYNCAVEGAQKSFCQDFRCAVFAWQIVRTYCSAKVRTVSFRVRAPPPHPLPGSSKYIVRLRIISLSSSILAHISGNVRDVLTMASMNDMQNMPHSVLLLWWAVSLYM